MLLNKKQKTKTNKQTRLMNVHLYIYFFVARIFCYQEMSKVSMRKIYDYGIIKESGN